METAIAFVRDGAVAGALGAVAKTAVAPVERVKLLLQTQRAHPDVRSATVRPYTGAIDCLFRVGREQGVLALWRGNTATLLRYAPLQAVTFAVRDAVTPATQLLAPRQSAFVAGGFAGFIATGCVQPAARTASAVGFRSLSGKPKTASLLRKQKCLYTTVLDIV